MPRIRTKPINPFIETLMDAQDPPAETLKELAERLDIDYDALRGYADILDGHPVYEALLRDAPKFKKCGVKNAEDLMKRLLTSTRRRRSS